MRNKFEEDYWAPYNGYDNKDTWRTVQWFADHPKRSKDVAAFRERRAFTKELAKDFVTRSRLGALSHFVDWGEVAEAFNEF